MLLYERWVEKMKCIEGRFIFHAEFEMAWLGYFLKKQMTNGTRGVFFSNCFVLLALSILHIEDLYTKKETPP